MLTTAILYLYLWRIQFWFFLFLTVPLNILKSYLMVLFQVFGNEILRYRSVLCISDQKLVAGLIVRRLCNNDVVAYCHFQKWRLGKSHRMKGKQGKTAAAFPGVYNRSGSQVRSPIVVRNKDWCFQVRVYNGSCARLKNKELRYSTSILLRTGRSVVYCVTEVIGDEMDCMIDMRTKPGGTLFARNSGQYVLSGVQTWSSSGCREL